MSAYLFDSSATVKRYITETGTAWIIGLFRTHSHNQIFVSEITLVEVISALTRRHRGLSAASVKYGKRAASRFQRTYNTKFFKVPADLALINEAARLAKEHYLRGYDAIQLATALQVDNERQSIGVTPLIFVSADTDLNKAAQSEGLSVENPDNYP